MLGLQYSDDGKKVTPCYRSGGNWRTFEDVDTYTVAATAAKVKWGKTHSLHALGRKTYDWFADDGYNNLGTWVG